MNAVTSDKRQVTRKGSDKGQVVSDRWGATFSVPPTYSVIPPTRFFRGGDAPQLFVLNAAMCSVAGAINGVWRLARDLLVLHYIEGLSPAGLGAVHRMPPARVEAALAEARREFVEVLGGLSEWVDEPEPDVGMVLRQFAGSMNETCVRTVRECVMQYIADCI
jgi:DNA-directed RNA polymerase specialized sigma24 family protein